MVLSFSTRLNHLWINHRGKKVGGGGGGKGLESKKTYNVCSQKMPYTFEMKPPALRMTRPAFAGEMSHGN